MWNLGYFYTNSYPSFLMDAIHKGINSSTNSWTFIVYTAWGWKVLSWESQVYAIGCCGYVPEAKAMRLGHLQHQLQFSYHGWEERYYFLRPEVRFCGPLRKKIHKVLGCYKKWRLISSRIGYLPGFKICRNFLIRVEKIVKVHGSSWHRSAGVWNCGWI